MSGSALFVLSICQPLEHNGRACMLVPGMCYSSQAQESDMSTSEPGLIHDVRCHFSFWLVIGPG